MTRESSSEQIIAIEKKIIDMMKFEVDVIQTGT